MATGDVLSGDQATVWIEDAGTIGTGLTTTYSAEITNFNVDGGEIDYESQAVFGGFIDLKKPQAQYEISMDVILRYGANADKWDALKAAGTSKMIAIQATDGTNYYWNAFNNVRIVNFDKEFEAEGEWRGTMTFKVSATDADGNSNEQYGDAGAATDAVNGVLAWS